jgi:two-component system sensor histidine kinase/response regulator
MEEYLWKKLGISTNFKLEERLLLAASFLGGVFFIPLALPFYFGNHSQAGYYLILLGIGLLILFILIRFGAWFRAAQALLFILATVFPILLFPLTGFFRGPVLYGVILAFLLSLVTSKGLLEQRLSFIHVQLLGLILIFELAPMASYSLGALYYATYFCFSVIFYLGTFYLKSTYDRNFIKGKEIKEQLEKNNAQLEQQMIVTKELSAQKDRLFSIIGHDLRSPLSGIEGYLNVMDHGDVPEEDRKIMQNELLRLTRGSRSLLDNLLEWAKRDTRAYHASKVDYPMLIKMVAEQLASLAAAKNINLQVLIDDGDGFVNGDTDMLEMIIRNLITNSIKFTPKGGWVKIRAYEMQSILKIEVEDNGIGMTETQRLRLLSPNREVRVGTALEKGVGLGLMLCTEFLTYMNGSIQVRSVKDQGSCFTVHLPSYKRDNIKE